MPKPYIRISMLIYALYAHAMNSYAYQNLMSFARPEPSMVTLEGGQLHPQATSPMESDLANHQSYPFMLGTSYIRMYYT